MGILQRIRSWFKGSDIQKPVSNETHLRNLLVEARRQQYMEQYTQALDTLTQAMTLADKEYDMRSKVDITLSRADILIEQGDYETAKFILSELEQDSEAREMTAPLAYALCSLGVVADREGNLELARDYFEKARSTAQSIHTDGATGRAEAHLAEVEAAITQHITRLQTELIQDSELDRIRTLVANQYIFGNETPGNRAGLYGYYHTLVGDLVPALNYPARIRTLDAIDLQRAAQQYLLPNAYGVVVSKPSP